MPIRGLPSLFALSLLVACRSEQSQPAADTATGRANQAVATPAASPSPAGPSANAGTVAAEAREVCDTVARRWLAVRFATAEVRDTVADPVNRDQVHPGRPDEILPPTAACVVVARADSGIPDDQKTPYWPAAGWSAIWSISSDGPDGGSLTYQRGLVRCDVANSFDGGDDSDSTVVPLKWFAQRTTCWRHNRALIPTDTGHPP